MNILFTLMAVILMPLATYAAGSSTTTDTDLAKRTRTETLAELLLTVPPEQRIIIPAIGTALAHIVVFTDTNCPYCQQLHGLREAIARRGIEIQYIFYPRSGPSADSYSQAIAVWCSADRLAALDKVFKGETLPAADCAHPVMAHYELALKLDLKGTPAIVTPDGVIAYGVPSRELLVEADH